MTKQYPEIEGAVDVSKVAKFLVLTQIYRKWQATENRTFFKNLYDW